MSGWCSRSALRKFRPIRPKPLIPMRMRAGFSQPRWSPLLENGLHKESAAEERSLWTMLHSKRRDFLMGAGAAAAAGFAPLAGEAATILKGVFANGDRQLVAFPQKR